MLDFQNEKYIIILKSYDIHYVMAIPLMSAPTTNSITIPTWSEVIRQVKCKYSVEDVLIPQQILHEFF